MLREPALGAAEPRADAQREAFLAEERVAAVAAADRPNRVVLREVTDETLLGVEVERRVEPAVEVGRVAERVERDAAHARHDAHVEHDVDAVGDLDADLREWRARRSHEVGHDVHRAALHRAVEQRAELGVRVLRAHPVVVRARGFFLPRADERQVLGARDVGRARAVEVAAGSLLGVQRDEDAVRDGLVGQALLLLEGAVAPVHAIWLGEARRVVDPGDKGSVRRWHIGTVRSFGLTHGGNRPRGIT